MLPTMNESDRELLTRHVRSRAENAFALAESERMNAEALNALVEEHGVQLRAFPDEIAAALREQAPAVLAQFADQGGLEKRIHESYVAMLDLLRPWSRESMAAYLAARAAV